MKESVGLTGSLDKNDHASQKVKQRRPVSVSNDCRPQLDLERRELVSDDHGPRFGLGFDEPDCTLEGFF
jgi:hypothetical protein